MRVAFGTDEDTPLTAWIEAYLLHGGGHEVIRVAAGGDWPDVGRAVGAAVASGKVERGVVCCWSGTGVSIAANKVTGVRAALCTDAATAEGARRWNDANVLAMGLRLTSETLAREMLDAFLGTSADESEQAAISRLEGPSPSPST